MLTSRVPPDRTRHRPLTSSQRLRGTIALAWPALGAAAHALHQAPCLAEVYPNYLLTLHWTVRATVPLMEVALARARALADTDPVAAGLIAYLPPHIEAERDHDEWLLEDLEVLGQQRPALLSRPPSATVAALVGAQYYWIQHYHPIALLGYMAVMEGYPPTPAWIQTMEVQTAYPAQAFRTLHRHAELDLEHRKDLDAVLDRSPLTPAHRALLGMSALLTVDLGSRALEELLEGDDKQRQA